MSNVTKDFGLQRFSVGNDYLPNKLQINYLYLSWTSEINIWRCYGVSYLYSIFECFLEVFDHWFVIEIWPPRLVRKRTSRYLNTCWSLWFTLRFPRFTKYLTPSLEGWIGPLGVGKGIAFQTWNCVVASSSLTPVGVSSIRIHKIRSKAIIWGPRHHLLGTETLT